MMQDPKTGALVPFDFDNIYKHLPVLQNFGYQIDFYSFDPLIDSSNMSPDFWAKLAAKITENYEQYDGFVVLHGSDTMAYTASALSFMLENLNKPVVLTGSQLPMGVVRTARTSSLPSRSLPPGRTIQPSSPRFASFSRTSCCAATAPPSSTPRTSTPSCRPTSQPSPRWACISNTTRTVSSSPTSRS